MRTCLVLIVALASAACGDASSKRLVSADVTTSPGDGCVVDEARPAKAPRTWMVREGDSLRRIAKKVYGDENLWKALRDANPGKVGEGDVITPGTDLVIPFSGI